VLQVAKIKSALDQELFAVKKIMQIFGSLPADAQERVFTMVVSHLQAAQPTVTAVPTQEDNCG
jgi:hypothetical protein